MMVSEGRRSCIERAHVMKEMSTRARLTLVIRVCVLPLLFALCVGDELRVAQDRRMVAIADRRHLLQLLEDQKQTMATLHAERDKLRSKTYPSFAALKAKPPQMSLLPDHREGHLMMQVFKPKPPAGGVAGGASRSLHNPLSSPRMKKMNP
jgi:cell division protein FtsB